MTDQISELKNGSDPVNRWNSLELDLERIFFLELEIFTHKGTEFIKFILYNIHHVGVKKLTE